MNATHSHLQGLDYSVVQQCMHCGLCLPTCPTYDATRLERNSPRGRIALMRAIADGRLEATETFAQEMYFCLGRLSGRRELRRAVRTRSGGSGAERRARCPEAQPYPSLHVGLAIYGFEPLAT